MKKIIIVRVSLLLICLSMFASCSYSFKGENPPEGIKTLFIPTVTDESAFGQANLGEITTLALKNKFIKDNTLQYAEKTSADGMLTCIIKTIKDEPLVVTGGETVSRRKVTVTINVELQNLKTKKDIWKKDFSDWGEYDSSTGGFSKRDAGVQAALDKLTDDILLETISNW